jgi:hypothetical protein
MKTLKLFLFGTALFLAVATQAQVSVNVNLGSPPMWGPAGYNEVQYYYLPDVEAYYDVPSANFIYLERGKWVHHKYLPSRYRNYDLYNGYKVVMTDYHGNSPYIHYKEYKYKYAKGYHGPAQKNIGARPAKGNSGPKMHSGGQSYKKSGPANQKGQSKGQGNKKGHGGGKDKR